MRLFLSILLLVAAPEGEAPPETMPQGQEPSLEAPASEDPCGSALHEALLGAELPEGFSPEGLYRVIRPGDMVTMDHVPPRLNIELDANGVITRIHCG